LTIALFLEPPLHGRAKTDLPLGFSMVHVMASEPPGLSVGLWSFLQSLTLPLVSSFDRPFFPCLSHAFSDARSPLRIFPFFNLVTPFNHTQVVSHPDLTLPLTGLNLKA